MNSWNLFEGSIERVLPTVHVEPLKVLYVDLSLARYPFLFPYNCYVLGVLVEDLEPTCHRVTDSNTSMIHVGFDDGKPSHTLVSANYPFLYPYDLNCLWLVESSEPDSKIRVDFLHVAFLCYTDTISVGEGTDPDKRGSLIVERGGVLKLRGVMSTGSGMWIRFSVFDCYLDRRPTRDYRYWDDSVLAPEPPDYETSLDFSYLDPHDSSVRKQKPSQMPRVNGSDGDTNGVDYRGFGVRLEVHQVSKGSRCKMNHSPPKSYPPSIKTYTELA